MRTPSSPATNFTATLTLSLSLSLFDSITAKLQLCCYPHHLATAAWMKVSLCHRAWSELSLESNIGPEPRQTVKMNQEQWGRACARSAVDKDTGATLPPTSLKTETSPPHSHVCHLNVL